MSEQDKQLQEALEAARRLAEDHVARHERVRLYPDAERVASVLEGLARRKLRFGDYYCPCRVLTKDPEQDARIVCPCAEGLAEIDRQGYCKCHLFASTTVVLECET